MDGLLEKSVLGGHWGVQLIAYPWELADRTLSVGCGCVTAGGFEGTDGTSERNQRADQKVQAS